VEGTVDPGVVDSLDHHVGCNLETRHCKSTQAMEFWDVMCWPVTCWMQQQSFSLLLRTCYESCGLGLTGGYDHRWPGLHEQFWGHPRHTSSVGWNSFIRSES